MARAPNGRDLPHTIQGNRADRASKGKFFWVSGLAKVIGVAVFIREFSQKEISDFKYCYFKGRK